MQVTKIRFANDNGVVPAGQYFSRLADNLRAANARAAAVVVEEYETQERKLEDRYRGRRAAARRSAASAEHMTTM